MASDKKKQRKINSEEKQALWGFKVIYYNIQWIECMKKEIRFIFKRQEMLKKSYDESKLISVDWNNWPSKYMTRK